MSYKPIAYTADADTYCESCTIDQYGYVEGADLEGNQIGAIFSWDEWWEPSDPAPQTLTCGSCFEELDTRA